MNIYLVITILIANIISIGIVYQFIKTLDKKEKLIFIATSVALMYVLISLIYWISGFGIDKNIHEQSKNFVLYLFVPVNVILIVPYFASKYMKIRENQISAEQFSSKMSVLIIILMLVLLVEYFYFRNIQLNIKELAENQNVENQNMINYIEDETINQNEINTNKNTNETISNEINNEIVEYETMNNKINNIIESELIVNKENENVMINDEI